MKLVFISSEQYLNGGSAVNRHMVYAKGLVEAGHDVTFLLLSKQTSKLHEFIEEGIKYICAYPENDHNTHTKIRKLILRFRSIRARKRIILEIHRKIYIDAIILLDVFVWILILIIRLAKNSGIKIFHERTENCWFTMNLFTYNKQ